MRKHRQESNSVGRPKFQLKLRAGDQRRIERLLKLPGLPTRNSYQLRALLLLATGQFTYREAAMKLAEEVRLIHPADVTRPDFLLQNLYAANPLCRILRPFLPAELRKPRVKPAPDAATLKSKLAATFSHIIQHYDLPELVRLFGGKVDLPPIPPTAQSLSTIAANRRFLAKAFVEQLNLSSARRLAASQLQLWVKRYVQDGLPGLLAWKPAHPRRYLKTVCEVFWLAAGVAARRVTDANQAQAWLQRRDWRISPAVASEFLNKHASIKTRSRRTYVKSLLQYYGFAIPLLPPDAKLVTEAERLLETYLHHAQ
jgi:hypothetical protein